MRLTQVEFKNFKRLQNARCNVDGKLIAFVGPNEAGKSSVLQGLEWLTARGALPDRYKTRDETVDESALLVNASFVLSEEDQGTLKDLELDVVPKRFSYGRQSSGYGIFAANPRPRFSREHLVRARELTVQLDEALMRHLRFVKPELVEFRSQLEALGDALSADQVEMLSRDAVAEASDAVTSADLSRSSPLFDETVAPQHDTEDVRTKISGLTAGIARSMEPLLAQLDDETPHVKACRRLMQRMPKFVFFGPSDRTFANEYDLSDAALLKKPPRSLRNLFELAGSSLEEAAEILATGDRSKVKTLELRINAQLDEVLQQSWRQEDLTLQVSLSDKLVEILIHENVKNRSASIISERSEGLRAFVALSCFLAVQGDSSSDKILLIDEAETHLHLDAQADLVKVLGNQRLASQVIYTTHSPGCLPPDIGTGVRLVRPRASDPRRSDLVNNFWTGDTTPGFSPLLFAMGAGAAAFSAVRRAVIAEGHSEMILLPSLLRLALDVEQLDYQVAPGLSSFSGDESHLEAVSGNTAYLVDGDPGGEALKRKLRRTGVQDDRMVSLPSGWTLESLVDPKLYLDTYAELLKESAVTEEVPTFASEPADVRGTIAEWEREHEVTGPGKVIVASRLIQKGGIRLQAGAKEVLVEVDAAIHRILG